MLDPHTTTSEGLQAKESQSDNRSFGVRADDYVVFPSSRSLLAVGIIAAVLSPLVGLILGAYFWARPQLTREGKIIVLVALVWLAAIFVNLIVF